MDKTKNSQLLHQEEGHMHHLKISAPSMSCVKSNTTIFWSCEVLQESMVSMSHLKREIGNKGEENKEDRGTGDETMSSKPKTTKPKPHKE